jgi:hypothetical protein
MDAVPGFQLILDGHGSENIGENTHFSLRILTKFRKSFREKSFVWLVQEYLDVWVKLPAGLPACG